MSSVILGGIDWFGRWAAKIAWLHPVFAVRPRHRPAASTRRRAGITLRSCFDTQAGCARLTAAKF